LDINRAQSKTGPAAKAARKQCEKLDQLFAETGNLFECHPDDPPWYSSLKPSQYAEDRLLLYPMQAQLLVPETLTLLASKKAALSN
jgi:hypothetical protein